MVLDLASQEGVSSGIHIATDGGGMSVMRGGVADTGPMSRFPMDDPEVQNVDLME